MTREQIQFDRDGMPVLQGDGKCMPGDLVEIERELYNHWAVYIGDGYVVHLVADEDGQSRTKTILTVGASVVRTTPARIEREELFKVAGKASVYKNNALDSEFRKAKTPLRKDIVGYAINSITEDNDDKGEVNVENDTKNANKLFTDDPEAKEYVTDNDGGPENAEGKDTANTEGRDTANAEGRGAANDTGKGSENATGGYDDKYYNVMSSNCEHFAMACRYGEKRSLQVTEAKAWLAAKALDGVLQIVSMGDKTDQRGIGRLQINQWNYGEVVRQPVEPCDQNDDGLDTVLQPNDFDTTFEEMPNESE